MKQLKVYLAILLILVAALVGGIAVRKGRVGSFPIPFVNQACGIQECHGMDLTCGPNVPEACTEIFMVGDGCRQFLSCATISGSCQALGLDKFNTCKTCIQECQARYRDDPVGASECDSECVTLVSSEGD